MANTTFKKSAKVICKEGEDGPRNLAAVFSNRV